jgi:hypothetical protein
LHHVLARSDDWNKLIFSFLFFFFASQRRQEEEQGGGPLALRRPFAFAFCFFPTSLSLVAPLQAHTVLGTRTNHQRALEINHLYEVRSMIEKAASEEKADKGRCIWKSPGPRFLLSHRRLDSLLLTTYKSTAYTWTDSCTQNRR